MKKALSWLAVIDNPTAIIPGHSIKEDDEVKCPVALVPAPVGGRPGAVLRCHRNALLIAAAPDLQRALRAALKYGTNLPPPIVKQGKQALAMARTGRKAVRR